MFFKRFRVQVILRVLLIALSIFLYLYYLWPARYYATLLVTGVIILFQVFALIRYVEKTNQHLSRFFMAVGYDDATSTFSNIELGTSFADLNRQFTRIMEKIRQDRSGKETQYRYLQTVIHHVGIGLLAFRPDGGVDLINNAAKRLFGVPGLKNIHTLETLSPRLVSTLLELKAGQRALVRIENRGMELALHAAEFRMEELKLTLVSVQDIRKELQEKEMEAWQTLIRVLTHEIMNSMTPITSLSSTVLELMEPHVDEKGNLRGPGMDNETVKDIGDALKTIHKRSRGLSHFVDSYRNMTLIPRPEFKIFSIHELFQRVGQLMENKIKENKIGLRWSVEPETLELTADPGLIEQVLINLVLNAVDALSGTIGGRIQLSAGMDWHGRVFVAVRDNGVGIAPEALSKVFIPFFSTKKQGSGIGLSISRQIMKQHNGSLIVHSEPDVETVFTLKF